MYCILWYSSHCVSYNLAVGCILLTIWPIKSKAGKTGNRLDLQVNKVYKIKILALISLVRFSGRTLWSCDPSENFHQFTISCFSPWPAAWSVRASQMWGSRCYFVFFFYLLNSSQSLFTSRKHSAQFGEKYKLRLLNTETNSAQCAEM